VKTQVNTLKWMYEHSGDIATVLGTVALFTPPPANAALGAVAIGFAAVDTFKSCKDGMSAECGMAMAGLIPGGVALRLGAKSVRAAKRADQLFEQARSAAKRARRNHHKPGGLAWVMRKRNKELTEQAINHLGDAMYYDGLARTLSPIEWGSLGGEWVSYACSYTPVCPWQRRPGNSPDRDSDRPQSPPFIGPPAPPFIGPPAPSSGP